MENSKIGLEKSEINLENSQLGLGNSGFDLQNLYLILNNYRLSSEEGNLFIPTRSTLRKMNFKITRHGYKVDRFTGKSTASGEYQF